MTMILDARSRGRITVKNTLVIVVLVIAVMGTALGVVYAKHQSRKLFIELQTLLAQRDDLEIEWEQLQLEQSTLSTEAVVDHAARTRLDMIVPTTDAVVYIRR